MPGLSELDSQRQILAYALLLGYAQQVATKLIDRQAQTLMDAVPSKDPDGRQPTQPAPTDGSSSSTTITTTTYSADAISNGSSSRGSGRAPAQPSS